MTEPSLAAVAPPPPESCPPPLAWQEVLQAVEEQGEPFEFEHADVRLEGLMLGQGPAIWCLGGFAGDRRLFSLLAWLLRDRFRCVLVDAGWAEPQQASTLQGALGGCYAEAFRVLETNQPVLFATAFGAQTALQLMATSPGVVQGAVLHAGLVRRRPSLLERAIAWGGARSSKRLIEIPNWPQIQEANHRRWFPPIDPTRWDFLLDNLGSTSARRWSTMARAAATCALTADDIRSIQTPVLLLRTEGEGPVATAAMNELLVHLPQVREETMHTSGHFAFLTHPHRVAKVIAGFVESLPRE
jgi:pimeloyl-ACP methyl ester carboxylesterase